MSDSSAVNPENNIPENKPDFQGTSPAPETPQPEKVKFSIFGSIQSIGVYAFLLASLFTLFTPNNLFSGQMLERVFQAWQANPTAVAPIGGGVVTTGSGRIGIVSGHWKNDSGSVCADGLTEEQVNLNIATLVQQKLTAEGYNVDLLEEFDPRLSQYEGIALISIHSDTCEWISPEATGFKVAAAIHSAYPEKASRLTTCLADRYQTRTGLKYLANSSSNDMTYYHAFDEIRTETTAAIIETGFLNLDREILTQKPDLVAQGIVDGLLCYILNENVNTVQPTP
jgi:N-acetylmuramoyl-L-alanine amidase